MGRSTDSDICKNVVDLGEFNGLLNYENDGQNASTYGPDGEVIKLPHRWIHNDNIRQYGRLFVDTFEKILRYTNGKTDVLQVHIVNTAEYANGGEEFYVAFSDRAKSVKRFCRDFGITEPIAKKDSVHQTL